MSTLLGISHSTARESFRTEGTCRGLFFSVSCQNRGLPSKFEAAQLPVWVFVKREWVFFKVPWGAFDSTKL